MGIQAPAEVKYRLIHEATLRDNNLLCISTLCRIAGVSRSGYYNWIGNADNRQQQENQDKADFDKILEAYRFRGYAKGARSIHMRLLHTGIRMNVKKNPAFNEEIRASLSYTPTESLPKNGSGNADKPCFSKQGEPGIPAPRS